MHRKWTRSRSVDLGMDQENFVQAFVAALTDPSVIQKLKSALIDDLSKEVHELREIVKAKDDRIKVLEDKVSQLELENDANQQYQRQNNLRISGLKENEGEDTYKVVNDLFSAMKVTPPIRMEDYDRVHRTGLKGEDRDRQILVKFTTFRARDRVFRSRKVLRQKPSDPESNGQQPAAAWGGTNQSSNQGSPVFRFGDPPPPPLPSGVYINEDLTKRRANLLFQARGAKKQGLINDCWSATGQILIKNYANKVIPIHTPKDLNDVVTTPGAIRSASQKIE